GPRADREGRLRPLHAQGDLRAARDRAERHARPHPPRRGHGQAGGLEPRARRASRRAADRHHRLRHVLARRPDRRVPARGARPEIGVASTKAFTSQVTVLLLLMLHLGRLRVMSRDTGRAIVEELEEIPGKIRAILDAAPAIREIAAQIQHHNNFLYLGRGVNFPVALEGALKLKEISYVHAEGYPAAEMKHGPIALIDENMPVVFVCTRDGAYEKVLTNMQEVRARHGKIIAVATEGDAEVHKLADFVIPVPATLDPLAPL